MRTEKDCLEKNQYGLYNQRFNINSQPNGILDLAFTVDDIKTVSQYIVESGGQILGKIVQCIVGYPAFHCYAKDPEGNVLHLAQNISNNNHSS